MRANQIHLFAQMAMDGLIYKGLKPVNWSPSSESALAEAEIEYKDVTAKTIYVKFKVTQGKRPGETGRLFRHLDHDAVDPSCQPRHLPQSGEWNTVSSIPIREDLLS
jgi:isoleucyl-tRNA synthetase